MPINITMPALSPTMEQGNLTKWLVKEGDTVSAGDVIAEIETDKATMEVEAVDEGTIAKLLVAAGTEAVKVNAVIAILTEEGEDAEEAAKAAPAANPVTGPAPSSPPKPEAAPPSTAPAAPKPAPAPSNSNGRVFSSPLARRIATEAGIDIALISGSGPYGRIVKRDVETALSSGSATPVGSSVSAAPVATGASAGSVFALYEQGSYELVKHDGMRKTIAKRLVEAKQSIPHFYVSVDCEIDALLALRKDINDAAPMVDEKPAYKVSVNDLIIKALARSLIAVPDANVSWTDEAMIRHKHADIGVAVSIPGGLITPIVRKADEKSVSQISLEMKELGARARDRKLKPEEYQGGTSAVSNMGMMGVKNFSAVINPPHATILAVGAGEQRAIVRGGQIVTATMMSVTLSTDHRAVDGALAAELIAAFKRYIEKPAGMLA